jgi:hypothetical protein
MHGNTALLADSQLPAAFVLVRAFFPQVMEVQARHADGLDGVRPRRHLAEVATPQQPSAHVREDQRPRAVLDVDGEMVAQAGDDRGGDADDAPTTP